MRLKSAHPELPSSPRNSWQRVFKMNQKRGGRGGDQSFAAVLSSPNLTVVTHAS